jgi:hypothetical protein
MQPSFQPSSEPSIKSSLKPSDEPSSKPSSTKLLEGLAPLGSSLDSSLLGSLGILVGLSLESPGEQSQSYVRSLGWNNHGSYHKVDKDSNHWLKRRRKSCWKGWRRELSQGRQGLQPLAQAPSRELLKGLALLRSSLDSLGLSLGRSNGCRNNHGSCNKVGEDSNHWFKRGR